MNNIIGKLKCVLYDPSMDYKSYILSDDAIDKMLDDKFLSERIGMKCMFAGFNDNKNSIAVDMQDVAASLTKIEKDVDGKLIGYFDVLDTPMGRLFTSLEENKVSMSIEPCITANIDENKNATDLKLQKFNIKIREGNKNEVRKLQ